ncbi:SoxR reducing system RseC family protein [Colwelliaceae bacterium 6441]
MIEEHARVVAIEQELITVESLVKSSCSGCQQLDTCGSGQIAKAFPQKRTSYTLFSELPVNVGDSVIIGLSEQVLLSAAWQVYMWPLIGLFLGGLFGQALLEKSFLSHELFALPLALLGGFIGFYLARQQQEKLSQRREWLPTLIKVVGK